MIKKCKICNVEKDINLFSRIKSIKNEWMYKNECKKCANIRNMKNYYIRTLHKVKAKEQRLNELTNIQLIESKKHFPPIQLVFNFYSNQTEINQHQLAKIYNLNQSHISDIVNRMTWKHI